jgi:hypothetical protein
VVVAGPGSRTSNVSEQAPGLGAAWLDSLPSGSSARSVGRLGRWAGTTAAAEAPGSFERENRRGSGIASRTGHPSLILDPIDPRGADRWDRGFVTKGALCRADPDLWELRNEAADESVMTGFTTRA